jgi:C4-dicarboxylate-specific signal transduction histidine kinase
VSDIAEAEATPVKKSAGKSFVRRWRAYGTSTPSPRLRPRILTTPAGRYSLAVALVACAAAAMVDVEKLAEKPVAFPFYAAVVISAWIGAGPGLVAVALSAIAVEFFAATPAFSLEVQSQDLPWFLSFIAFTLMAFGWSWQRRRAESALETTVQQRTADLLQANAALQAEMAEREAAQAERDRSERALRDAEAELARTLRLAAMAELAGAIAHEINQPLAAITANASACVRSLDRQPPLFDNARDAARCIVADGHRAGDVITRIRALFNKEQSKQQRLSVNNVIRHVIQLSRPRIGRQDVEVRTELMTPAPMVEADLVQLQQVLMNLVTNALEAMADVSDRPHRLVVRSERQDNATVVVSVADTGGGIDPSAVTHIFDSFYTTKPAGIGLGLAISRSIIEAHGGSLSVMRTSDVGATLGFTLPIAVPVGR